MTKFNTLSACKPNSAWHSWQTAGLEWRAANPTGDPKIAADQFSSEPRWPDAGRSARYRAFLEGATA